MSATNEFVPITEQDIAEIVAKAGKKRRQIVNAVFYVETSDQIVLFSRPFALFIPRKNVQPFRTIPPEDMRGIAISAAGTTIKLDKHDIHIEAAGFLAYAFNDMRRQHSGGPFMDFFEPKNGKEPKNGER